MYMWGSGTFVFKGGDYVNINAGNGKISLDFSNNNNIMSFSII